MTPASLEAALLRFVNDRLLGNGATPRVSADTLLFAEGYLDSIRVLDLIAFLERTLGRRIPDRAVKLANFRSIRAITAAFAGPDATNSVREDPVFERRSDTARFASPIERLREAGDLEEPAPGLASLRGSVLALCERIDAAALAWADELGATRHEYPSLIPIDVLRRAGYVRSFAPHLTLAGHLEPRDAVLTRAGRDGEPIGTGDLAAPSEALAPALCYHCYPAAARRALGTKPTILTMRGRCFRHEADTAAPLERLREFTMREIVVLGTFEQVDSVRTGLIERAKALLDTLDLDGVIEVASDPFFGELATGQRALQHAASLKYELRLTLEGGRRIAVASFNHHLDHFGRCFGIRLHDGSVAHSGCVALGLERWGLAILTQHGTDATAWPASLQESVPAGEARA